MTACQQRPDEPVGVLVPVDGAKIGSTAPTFSLPDPTGNTIAPEQFRGKVVVLDFWATWCPPCIEALPELKALWSKYRNQEFALVGVSADFDVNAWKNFVVENGMDWAHVHDRDDQYSAAYRYGVVAIPETFVIDRNGVVVAYGLRGDALDRKVEETLRK